MQHRKPAHNDLCSVVVSSEEVCFWRHVSAIWQRIAIINTLPFLLWFIVESRTRRHFDPHKDGWQFSCELYRSMQILSYGIESSQMIYNDQIYMSWCFWMLRYAWRPENSKQVAAFSASASFVPFAASSLPIVAAPLPFLPPSLASLLYQSMNVKCWLSRGNWLFDVYQNDENGFKPAGSTRAQSCTILHNPSAAQQLLLTHSLRSPEPLRRQHQPALRWHHVAVLTQRLIANLKSWNRLERPETTRASKSSWDGLQINFCQNFCEHFLAPMPRADPRNWFKTTGRQCQHSYHTPTHRPNAVPLYSQLYVCALYFPQSFRMVSSIFFESVWKSDLLTSD